MFRFERVWRFVPVLVIGINQLPRRCIAVCLGLVVQVRKSHFDDLPTIAHELAHCRQSIKGLGLIHFCRYNCSAAYRLKCEAEAFAAEICQSADVDRISCSSKAIESLTHCYGLNCTPCAARKAIHAHLHKKSVAI